MAWGGGEDNEPGWEWEKDIQEFTRDLSLVLPSIHFSSGPHQGILQGSEETGDHVICPEFLFSRDKCHMEIPSEQEATGTVSQ